MNKLTLEALPYDYKALEPVMSATVLALHHDKHHQAYVDGANKLIDKLVSARESQDSPDYKALAKELSFHLGGHILHNLFWRIMRAPQNNNRPAGDLLKAIETQFGSWERFQAEFEQTALSVEGSGWAALYACPKKEHLLLGQIEKHNVNIYPGWQPILVLDVWEHSYYPDYQNRRADFVKAFWQIVNWDEVAKNFGLNTETASCPC